MTDQSRHPGIDDETARGPDRGAPPGTPRWVWVSAIVVGVVIALATVFMLVSGGQHGPGQHMPTGGAPTSGITRSLDLGGTEVLAGARA